MKKGPEIRVIGNAPEEIKEQERVKVENAFSSHLEFQSPEIRQKLEKFEYPKSEKEIALINFANTETNRLMEEAGIEPYDIPLENFHILPPEIYNTAVDGGGVATTFFKKQGILFDARYFRDNPVHFGATALHETLHLKAHLTLEVGKEGEEIQTTPYRQGVSVQALQQHGLHGHYHEHFSGLHEAIVSEQEKRSLDRLLEQPTLTEERAWLQSEHAQELKRDLAKEKKIPEDDIFWVGKNKNDWEGVFYRGHREVLTYVCTEIQKQFPEKYVDISSVYKEFLKAHFNGDLIGIGRLVDKTFGTGSFRLLGNMGTDNNSAVLHLESLRGARLRQIKTHQKL